MATDRKVPYKYFTKDPEKIWNVWTTKQRAHFLYDHLSYGEEIEENLEFKEFHKLPDKIQTRLKQHIQMGRYNLGGSMDEGGEISQNKIRAILSRDITQQEEDEFLRKGLMLHYLQVRVAGDPITEIVFSENNPNRKMNEDEIDAIIQKVMGKELAGAYSYKDQLISRTYIFDADWEKIKNDILSKNYSYVIFIKDGKEYLYMPRKYGSEYNKKITESKEHFFKKAPLVFAEGGEIKVSEGNYASGAKLWRVTDGDKIGVYPQTKYSKEDAMKKFKSEQYVVFYVSKETGGMRERHFNNKEEADIFAKTVNSEAIKYADGGLIGIEVLHDTRFIQKALDAGRRYIFLSELTAPRHCYFTRSASVYNIDGKFLLYRNNLLDSKYYIKPQ